MTANISIILRNSIPENAGNDVADVLAQSRLVADAMRELGWSIVEMELGHDLGKTMDTLRAIRPDVVFNLVESVLDMDELAVVAPAMLRSLGLAFTGSDTAALLVGNDKLAAKEQLAAAGLPVPPGVGRIGLEQGRFPGAGRYIVKSRCEHASKGLDNDCVMDVGSAQALLAGMNRCSVRFGGEPLAEQFIAGREFSVALLETENGVMALGCAEMRFSEELAVAIVGYDAKWTEGSEADRSTIRSFAFHEKEPELASALMRLGCACFEELGLAGYARVDFRVDEYGQPYIIDVNANPCLSPDAGFMATAARAGWQPRAVVAAIVSGALKRNGNTNTK